MKQGVQNSILGPSPCSRLPTWSHSLWRYHRSVTPSHFQAQNFWSFIPSQDTRHLEFSTCTSTPAYITYTQQWSRSPRSFPPTVPGTAKTHLFHQSFPPGCLDLDPFQPGSPLMRLSVTKVVALLLASAKSWFPPLTPWLTYLLQL